MDDPLPQAHTCSFENGYNVGHEAGLREGYLQGRLSMIEEAAKAEPVQEELASGEIALRFGLTTGQRCTVYRNEKGQIIGAIPAVSNDV